MTSATTTAQGAGISGLTPMALADLMLLEVLARGHGSLLLRPEADAYSLSFHGETGTPALASVPATLAEATIVRLALISGQSLSPPLVEKVNIRLASHRGADDVAKAEVLISLRPTSSGCAAELFALVGARRHDEISVVSGIDGLPDVGNRPAKYEVIGELGRGGMGIVYLARHVTLEKQVALKVLSPAMARRQVLAAQFVVEARAACRAQHPAIIDVTDFGRLSDGRNFLVMEHIDWPTLRQELEREPLTPMRALGIARSIASGVEAAHAHGVVHRDLKPENIFVGDGDQVKVADFGLAQTTEVGSREPGLEGICFGTVPYMAPEQTLGQAVDHRADIYAFGCILHELLTGSTPYANEDSKEVINGHRHSPVPDLPTDSSLSPTLVRLHAQLLGKQPADRPDSLGLVITFLDQCMAELR